MEPGIRKIPAKSKHQAMEWSLVLVSQDIETTVMQEEEAWFLAIPGPDYGRALQELKAFLKENKAWKWRQVLPMTELVFHWGAGGWAILLLFFFLLSDYYVPAMKSAGILNGDLVRQGEWHRLFTAVTLHADVGHFLANLTTGFLLLGFCMASYGPGYALFWSFVGGAAGNLAGYYLYGQRHLGLGASGMVCAALGLLSTNLIASLKSNPHAFRTVVRSVLGGCAIFLMIGFNPKSDLVAHVAGFIWGTMGGIIYSFRPTSRRLRQVLDQFALGTSIFFLIASWFLALSR